MVLKNTLEGLHHSLQTKWLPSHIALRQLSLENNARYSTHYFFYTFILDCELNTYRWKNLKSQNIRLQKPVMQLGFLNSESEKAAIMMSRLYFRMFPVYPESQIHWRTKPAVLHSHSVNSLLSSSDTASGQRSSGC